MYTVPSICPFSGCGKNVDIVDEGSRRDSTSSQTSGTSTLVGEFNRSSYGYEETKHHVEESSNTTSILPHKRIDEPISADSSSNKKSAKKEDSSTLKKPIKELITSQKTSSKWKIVNFLKFRREEGTWTADKTKEHNTANFLDNLEESTYDVLDATGTNIIEDIKNETRTKLNDESSSDESWKLENENESTEEDDESIKNQRSKQKLFCFVGAGEIDMNISNIQKMWILDEVNISDIFFRFHQSSVTKASNGSIETASEILALNYNLLDARLVKLLTANSGIMPSNKSIKNIGINGESCEDSFVHKVFSPVIPFEHLLIVEIKPADRASSNKDTLNDLVKLGNELKDCIDKMIDDGIYENAPVCGILVKGKRHPSSYQTSLNRTQMTRPSFHTPIKVPPQNWETLNQNLKNQCKSPSARE
ncbi:8105_t:CDS:10 [Ambispora leptoticha]|uniref:8105_t:CDS:1 n=1 Tax=Ambispora leptoticha TaxID=144679 RepID=A0A9N8W993_9GLOM|nr:8105_t:CDS:10 [Ambispora leptoticha]